MPSLSTRTVADVTIFGFVHDPEQHSASARPVEADDPVLEQLLPAVRHAVQAGSRKVLADLSELCAVTPPLLQALRESNRIVSAAGGRFAIADAPGTTSDALSEAGQQVGDEASALQFFNPRPLAFTTQARRVLAHQRPVLVLELNGKLTDEIEGFNTLIRALIPKNSQEGPAGLRLLLDFAGVREIDVAATLAMLRWLTLPPQHHHIKLLNAPALLRQRAQSLHISSFDDEASALRAFEP